MNDRMFRYYCHTQNAMVDITYEQIIAQHFDAWAQTMRQKGHDHVISRDNCVKHWQQAHWADDVSSEFIA